MDVSGEIHAARKRARMSQVEFAVHIGAGLSTVQRWEDGTSYPKHHLHVVALERMGVPLELMHEAMAKAQRGVAA
jgi:DNA-binding XRE family transcriptional regulator